jgi:hypothetical protein
MRLLLVPLIVASPAMCCCWFGPVDGLGGRPTALATGGEPREGCCPEPAETCEPPASEPDGCHQDGPCGEDQQDGCACPKPAASPADGGTPPQPGMPGLLLAWQPASALPDAREGAPARWSPLARPPPLSLQRLCVLRL